jgi:hypothetical protein
MPRKRPLTLSPWRGKRRPISQVRAVYDRKAMGKRIPSRGRGKGEGLFLKSVSWLKSEKLILVLPTDSLEDPR